MKIIVAALAALLMAASAALADPPNIDPAVHDGASLKRLSGLAFPDPDVLPTSGGVRVFGTGAGIPSMQVNADGSRSKRAATLKKPPWAATEPKTWAPDVWQTYGPLPTYVMYFTAVYAKTGRHCVAVAKASAPEGPYKVTNKKRPTWCSPVAGHEVIDPTSVVDGSQRYMVFKDNLGNASDFRIQALAMNPDGLSRVKGAAPRDLVTSATERMENPAFTYHDGTWWLFLSRGDYTTCGYSTDARASASFLGPYGPPKNVATQKLTSAATRGGLCGPGGASLSQEGASTRITLHAYKKGIPGDGKPRLPWTAFLSWNKKGKPFID